MFHYHKRRSSSLSTVHKWVLRHQPLRVLRRVLEHGLIISVERSLGSSHETPPVSTNHVTLDDKTLKPLEDYYCLVDMYEYNYRDSSLAD